MFKVFRQHFLRKYILVDNNEADSIGSPFNDISILMILNRVGLTFNSSYVFLRKVETALGFLLRRTDYGELFISFRFAPFGKYN